MDGECGCNIRRKEKEHMVSYIQFMNTCYNGGSCQALNIRYDTELEMKQQAKKKKQLNNKAKMKKNLGID